MATVTRERIPTKDPERLTLEISRYNDRGIVAVHCEGDLEAYTADWFQELVERHLASDHHSLIVDLTKTNLVDAHSWGLLVHFLKQTRKLGGGVCLVITEGQNLVRKVFEITKLQQIFSHCHNMETALALL